MSDVLKNSNLSNKDLRSEISFIVPPPQRLYTFIFTRVEAARLQETVTAHL